MGGETGVFLEQGKGQGFFFFCFFRKNMPRGEKSRSRSCLKSVAGEIRTYDLMEKAHADLVNT